MWYTKTKFLFAVVIVSEVMGLTVHRYSNEKVGSLASSTDYFSNVDGTSAFCHHRDANCRACGSLGECCNCQCSLGKNFFSEAIGCLSPEKIQIKVRDAFGYRCDFGVNTLSKDDPTIKIPSFRDKAQLISGLQIQETVQPEMDISKLNVACEVEKLNIIDLNGQISIFSVTSGHVLFSVLWGSRTFAGTGLKMFNVKLFKFNGTSSDWQALAGKLFALSVICTNTYSKENMKSCLLFNVNGTDSMIFTTKEPRKQSTNILGPPNTKQAKFTNGTGDGGKNLRDVSNQSSLTAIIAGVVVGFLILLIVVIALFFLKRKTKKGKSNGRRKKLKLELENATDVKAETRDSDYDYADPDKLRFKKPKKEKTLNKSNNPLYSSGDGPDDTRERENELYESDGKPKKKPKSTGVYEPLAGVDDPPVYNDCSRKSGEVEPSQPDDQQGDYSTYMSADSPRYQALAERDASPEYKGLYKTPRQDGSENDNPADVADHDYAEYESTRECPDSPVYKEVYPDWS